MIKIKAQNKLEAPLNSHELSKISAGSPNMYCFPYTTPFMSSFFEDAIGLPEKNF